MLPIVLCLDYSSLQKTQKSGQSRDTLSRSHGEDYWPMASMMISAITNAAAMPAPAFEQFRQQEVTHVRYCAWGVRDVRAGHFSTRSRVFR